MQNHGANIIKILNRKIIFIKLHILVHSGLNCNNGNNQKQAAFLNLIIGMPNVINHMNRINFP